MKTIAALLAFLPTFLVACQKDEPIPARDGTCVVVSYVGERAAERQCAYRGYLWTCDAVACQRGRISLTESAAIPSPDASPNADSGAQ